MSVGFNILIYFIKGALGVHVYLFDSGNDALCIVDNASLCRGKFRNMPSMFRKPGEDLFCLDKSLTKWLASVNQQLVRTLVEDLNPEKTSENPNHDYLDLAGTSFSSM